MDGFNKKKPPLNVSDYLEPGKSCPPCVKRPKLLWELVDLLQVSHEIPDGLTSSIVCAYYALTSLPPLFFF